MSESTFFRPSKIVEEAFSRIHGRQLTDADRSRLSRLYEALGDLPENDPWRAILLLEARSSAGASLDAITEVLPQSIAAATREGMADFAADVGILSAFIRDEGIRKTVGSSLRESVASEAASLNEMVRSETKSVLSDIRYAAKDAVSQAVVPLSLRYLWAGSLVCLMLLTALGFSFVHILAAKNYDDAYRTGYRERAMIEARFADGLDAGTRALLERRNGELPPKLRLMLR